MGSYAQALEHKQALSDEEHEQKVDTLIDEMQKNQAKLSTLKDENGNPLPGYDETLGNLQNNFRDLRLLYDPKEHPGAIQRIGWKLTDALHLTKAADRQKKNEAREAVSPQDKFSAHSWAGAAPISPGQTAIADAKTKNAAAMEMMQGKMKMLHTLFPNATPEQMQSWQNDLATSITGAKPIPDKYFKDIATTTDEEGKPHYWRIPMSGDPPEEVDFKGQKMVPKNPPHPGTSKFAQAEIAYRHDHNIPETEPLTTADINYIDQQIALSSTAPSSTVTNTLRPDMYNRWTPVTETNQRVPGIGTILHDPRGPVQGPPSGVVAPAGQGKPGGAKETPKTLDGVKKKAQTLNPTPPHHAGVSVGTPVFQGPYAPFTAANKDYSAAVGLAAAAHAAEHAPKDVIAGLQREVAGRLQNTLEKRFNLQAMDNLISHYGIANDFQTWLTRTESGALPPQVFHELVAMADNNVLEKKTALESATPPPIGTDQNGPSNPDIEAIVNIINQKHAQPAH